MKEPQNQNPSKASHLHLIGWGRLQVFPMSSRSSEFSQQIQTVANLTRRFKCVTPSNWTQISLWHLLRLYIMNKSGRQMVQHDFLHLLGLLITHLCEISHKLLLWLNFCEFLPTILFWTFVQKPFSPDMKLVREGGGLECSFMPQWCCMWINQDQIGLVNPSEKVTQYNLWPQQEEVKSPNQNQGYCKVLSLNNLQKPACSSQFQPTGMQAENVN